MCVVPGVSSLILRPFLFFLARWILCGREVYYSVLSWRRLRAMMARFVSYVYQ